MVVHAVFENMQLAVGSPLKKKKSKKSMKLLKGTPVLNSKPGQFKPPAPIETICPQAKITSHTTALFACI